MGYTFRSLELLVGFIFLMWTSLHSFEIVHLFLQALEAQLGKSDSKM